MFMIRSARHPRPTRRPPLVVRGPRSMSLPVISLPLSPIDSDRANGHSERSEESRSSSGEILRFAQDDTKNESSLATSNQQLATSSHGDPFNPHKILNHFDRLQRLVKGELVFPITVEVD